MKFTRIMDTFMFNLIDRSATIVDNKATYWVEVKSKVFFIAGHADGGEEDDDDKGTHNGATAAGK